MRSSVPEETMKQFGLSGKRATEALLNRPAIDSNLIAFNYHNKTIIQGLFDPWLKCLLEESCAVPSTESSEAHHSTQVSNRWSWRGVIHLSSLSLLSLISLTNFGRLRRQKYQFDLAALTAAFYAGGFADRDIAKKRNDLHISSSEPRDAQRRRRLFRRLF